MKDDRKVAFVYPYLFKYRVQFHKQVRDLLAAKSVAYDLFYADPPADLKCRNDNTELDWATKTPVTYLSRSMTGLTLQRIPGSLRKYDLVIMQQENRLLLNYYIHLLNGVFGQKIAYFGHGRNFQSRNVTSPSERFKRIMATKVNWWFAYNDLSASIVSGLGFPKDRITSVNNSIDTRTISADISRITPSQLEARRQEFGIKGKHIGIYIGSLYEDKRLNFLIETAVLVRQKIEDFELVVIGAGPDANVIVTAAKKYAFIHYKGAIHGQAKHELALMASVFLIPGAVGLAVLDAFAYGLPLVTTEDAYHGPEIHYLRTGVNGLVVSGRACVQTYANAVVSIFNDDGLRHQLGINARKDAEQYSTENMAERFVRGVLAALSA